MAIVFTIFPHTSELINIHDIMVTSFCVITIFTVAGYAAIFAAIFTNMYNEANAHWYLIGRIDGNNVSLDIDQ